MRRILVIATRQIGDVLLTTPLIRAARARWPQAHIDVLGFEGQMGMLQGNTDINDCLATPPRLGLLGGLRLTRKLWRRYDLALVTQPGDRAHILGWIAAACRSGLLAEQGGSRWWKRRLLRHAVTVAGDLGEVHVVAEKLRLLDPWLDPATQAPHPRVVPPAARALPADLAQPLKTGYLVMHAPSMWTYKQWPTEQFSEVLRALLAEGHQVVLTGSDGERDQACIAPLRTLGTAPALLDASGRLDFGQLRTLLEGAALYLGPDTSVSHLAAATGTRTVAVFGPTNPLRWAPWPQDGTRARSGSTPASTAIPMFLRHAPHQTRGNVTLLQGAQACVPCGRAGCDDHHHSRSECLQSIESGVVTSRVRALLQEPPSRASAQ